MDWHHKQALEKASFKLPMGSFSYLVRVWQKHSKASVSLKISRAWEQTDALIFTEEILTMKGKERKTV